MEVATASESRPELEQEIRRRIEACGGIPFREFMELCLYHPEHGYYMRTRQRIGREGDFFTSSSVHALFGRLLGRQLQEMWHLLGQGAFTIAEQGAGEGHLCLDLLDALAEECPEFYRQLRYCLVEISPDNRRRQEQLLARHRERIAWVELADLAGMEGCLLSNELLDAFPVRLLERHEQHFKEVFLVERDGMLAEDLRPVEDDTLQAYFAWLGVTPTEGNRFEVSPQALPWMNQVAGLLRRGFVITIDYGYPASELYAPWRQSGTLMCYHRHTSSDDPYQRIGNQDITAHVDFTALQKAGAESGLEPLFFGEQYRFLLGLGFVEALCALEARESDPRRAQALRMTLKNLIMPDGGMGETFKVLVQGKGVGRPTLACARRIADVPLPAANR